MTPCRIKWGFKWPSCCAWRMSGVIYWQGSDNYVVQNDNFYLSKINDLVQNFVQNAAFCPRFSRPVAIFQNRNIALISILFLCYVNINTQNWTKTCYNKYRAWLHESTIVNNISTWMFLITGNGPNAFNTEDWRILKTINLINQTTS